MSVEAIIAGHICLDVIPELPRSGGDFRFRPGTLVPAGPVTISTGGCVPNTGLALHRLGATVRLMGKVADDPFGRTVGEMLTSIDDHLARGLLVAPGENTSYSVILSPPGEDRMILHFPGTNDTFEAGDIPQEAFAKVRLFHFGYPPIMARMYKDGGENLSLMMARAKAAGLTTSLDMAYTDPSSPGGGSDWRHILTATLPSVDVFLPSLEETLLMLDPEESRELLEDGSAALEDVPAERVSALGEELISMGAAIVGLKAGERGMYVRTATEERLAEAGPAIPRDKRVWARRELWSSVFETEAVGTTGAGDATVAGFLFGLLKNMSPEETVTAACAVAASSVEAADATGGVKCWDETRERIESGWKRRRHQAGEAWSEGDQLGLWIGLQDSFRT